MAELGFSAEALPDPGEIASGTDLGQLIAGIAAGRISNDGIIAVSHKVVSKAEGCMVDLDSIDPGERATKLAADQGRDPRTVQLILDQSAKVLRAEHGVLICETHHGFVCANAGVDESNLPATGTALTLPPDPDASAVRIRAGIEDANGLTPAVVIGDSFGRAWRLGQLDVAIGCAGLAPIDDWRGRADRAGRRLQATEIAVADAIAAAADLSRSKDSGTPFVLIEGLGRYVIAADGPGARALRRPAADDLFRR